MFEIFGGIVVLTIMVTLSGIRVVKEHDRLVVYRFGKIIGTKGTGVQVIVPLIDKVQLVDMRIGSIPLENLDEVTSDQYPVNVSAFCMFQINDAAKAVSKIDDPVSATTESARSALRLVIGQQSLKDVMAHRRMLNTSLKVELECRTRHWGIRIKSFEITQVKVTDEVRKQLPVDQIEIVDEIVSDDSYEDSKPKELAVSNLSAGEIAFQYSTDMN